MSSIKEQVFNKESTSSSTRALNPTPFPYPNGPRLPRILCCCCGWWCGWWRCCGGGLCSFRWGVAMKLNFSQVFLDALISSSLCSPRSRSSSRKIYLYVYKYKYVHIYTDVYCVQRRIFSGRPFWFPSNCWGIFGQAPSFQVHHTFGGNVLGISRFLLLLLGNHQRQKRSRFYFEEGLRNSVHKTFKVNS